MMGGITIKYKLILLIMAMCVFSLVLTGTAFIVWSDDAYRRNAMENLSMNAAMIANQSRAALVFNDVEDARRTLASLEAQPDVAAAELRDAEGERFAYYLREGEQESLLDIGNDRVAGSVFSDRRLVVARSILLDGEKIGTIIIISDTAELAKMREDNIRIVVSVVLVVILLAYIISTRVQRIISGPILFLAETARIVTRDKNYNIRARKTADDEVGLLIDAFNEMLEQVHIGQEALMKARDELEDKVRERTAELEEKNRDLSKVIDKLESSNQQLQEFAYVASHDLREPLRKISSFGRLLQDSLEGKLDPDDQENFDFMIDGAQRMQQMVEALLVYSRVATHGGEFRPVDLNLVVEQIRSLDLAVKIEQTGGRIEVPEPLPTVMGDPVQLGQLLQNLIANGLKYQPPGTTPVVTVRVALDADTVKIEVQDNGIGIKEDYFDTIFTMFRRLHGRGEYEGAGIGLTICKRIVERHNGTISVKSAFGEGTTFWFTLPYDECVAGQDHLQEPAELCSERASL